MTAHGAAGDPGACAQKHVAQGPGIAIDQKTDHTMVEMIAQEIRPPQLHAIQTTVQVGNCCQQKDCRTFLVSSNSFAEGFDTRHKL